LYFVPCTTLPMGYNVAHGVKKWVEKLLRASRALWKSATQLLRNIITVTAGNVTAGLAMSMNDVSKDVVTSEIKSFANVFQKF